MLEVLYVLPVSLTAVSMATAVQTCMFVVLNQALEENTIYFTRYITTGLTCLPQIPRGIIPGHRTKAAQAVFLMMFTGFVLTEI